MIRRIKNPNWINLLKTIVLMIVMVILNKLHTFSDDVFVEKYLKTILP